MNNASVTLRSRVQKRQAADCCRAGKNALQIHKVYSNGVLFNQSHIVFGNSAQGSLCGVQCTQDTDTKICQVVEARTWVVSSGIMYVLIWASCRAWGRSGWPKHGAFFTKFYWYISADANRWSVTSSIRTQPSWAGCGKVRAGERNQKEYSYTPWLWL